MLETPSPEKESELNPHIGISGDNPGIEVQNKENIERFEQYKTVIAGAISVLQREKGGFTGDLNGVQYEVTMPHLRRGKHAFVAIVDIKNSDGSFFSCVLRNKSEDAETYLKHASAKPIIKEYVPQLYGFIDGWVVMEKLSGLELEELVDKFKTDKEFSEKYVNNVCALIEETANMGVEIHDVAFVNGHNCMVDPHTGKIKIVEQKALVQSLFNLKPHEIITDELLNEIGHISNNLYEVDPDKINLVFQILRKVFINNKPEELYKKSRAIKPTHPEYKSAWYVQNIEDLSEEEHRRILDDPYLREAYTVNYYDNGFAEAFTPALINSVTQNDFEAFKELVRDRKYEMNITDKGDSRYGQEIIPDNQ